MTRAKVRTSNPVKRALVLLVALVLSAGVYAIDLPYGAKVELKNDAGVVVGVGKVDDDGKLEFDALANLAGFATLTITYPDGTSATYDALFGESGEVLVVDENQEILSLAELAARAGLGLDFETEDDLGDDDGDDQSDDGDDDRDDDRDDDGDDGDDGDDRSDDGDDDRDDGDDSDDSGDDSGDDDQSDDDDSDDSGDDDDSDDDGDVDDDDDDDDDDRDDD